MIVVRMTTDSLDNAIDYPTATKWHVDEQGCLHLIAGKGNVGTHAANTWSCVVDDARTAPKPPDDLQYVDGWERWTITYKTGEILSGRMPKDEVVRFQELAEGGKVDSILYKPPTAVRVKIRPMPGVNETLSKSVESTRVE